MTKFVISARLDTDKTLTMLDVPKQNQGENNSSEIEILLPAELAQGNIFFLEFLCPQNKKYISPRMEPQQRDGEYFVTCPIPSCVLRTEGFVQLQLAARDSTDNTVVFKSTFSNRASFFVHSAVNATMLIVSDNDYFASLEGALAQAQSANQAVLNFIDDTDDLIDERLQEVSVFIGEAQDTIDAKLRAVDDYLENADAIIDEKVEASRANALVQLYRIVAHVTSVEELPTASSSLLGNCYSVGTSIPYYIYVCEEQNGVVQWINHGVLCDDPATVPQNTINPNLLINSNFQVNTRNKTSYSETGYCADRWLLSDAASFLVESKTLTMDSQGAMFTQALDNPSFFGGKTITLSANIEELPDNISFGLLIFDGSNHSQTIASVGKNSFTYSVPQNISELRCGVVFLGTTSQSIKLDWFKLELGNTATTYSPKSYSEDFAACGGLQNDVGHTTSARQINNLLGAFDVISDDGKKIRRKTGYLRLLKWQFTEVETLSNGLYLYEYTPTFLGAPLLGEIGSSSYRGNAISNGAEWTHAESLEDLPSGTYLCFNTDGTKVQLLFPTTLTLADVAYWILIQYERADSQQTDLNYNFFEQYLASSIQTIGENSNYNLVINGDFRVNQRGQTVYNSSNAPVGSYTVDRWKHTQGSDFTLITNTNGKGGITITADASNSYSVRLEQVIEGGTALYYYKPVGVSVVMNNTYFGGTALMSPKLGTSKYLYDSSGTPIARVYFGPSAGALIVRIEVYIGKTVNIEWVKLELGSTFTPYYPRPYAEELALCQRYFQVLTANYWVGKTTGVATIGEFHAPLIRPMRTVNSIYNFDTASLSVSKTTDLESSINTTSISVNRSSSLVSVESDMTVLPFTANLDSSLYGQDTPCYVVRGKIAVNGDF